MVCESVTLFWSLQFCLWILSVLPFLYTSDYDYCNLVSVLRAREKNKNKKVLEQNNKCANDEKTQTDESLVGKKGRTMWHKSCRKRAQLAIMKRDYPKSKEHCKHKLSLFYYTLETIAHNSCISCLYVL